MYPVERELVNDLLNEPFALVGVNTDLEKSTLREAEAAGEITWRCWWDGPPGGPISTRWGVDSYPTFWLIDPQGIVRNRYKGVVEKQTLREDIDRLLHP